MGEREWDGKKMFWVEKMEKLISGGTKGGSGASISHSRVSTKFRFKMTLLNFWIKLTQKGYLRTKKNQHYHRINHIQINLDPKFQLQQTILIFRPNFKEKYTSGRKHKKMSITI